MEQLIDQPENIIPEDVKNIKILKEVLYQTDDEDIILDNMIFEVLNDRWDS